MMNTKKNDILLAADRLFSKKGYSATSMDDIVDEAKTSKGNLYYHFPSKQEFLLATISHKSELWQDEWQKQYNSHDSPIHSLYQYVDISVTYFIDPLFNEAYDATHFGIFSAEQCIAVDRIIEQQQQPLITIIENGIKNNYLKPRDANFIATLIFALMCGLSDIESNATQDNQASTLRNSARQSIDLLLEGIRI